VTKKIELAGYLVDGLPGPGDIQLLFTKREIKQKLVKTIF
jgi:hypothetical protein